MICYQCQSTNIKSRGSFQLASGSIKKRYECRDCGKSFSKLLENEQETASVYIDEFEDSDENLIKNQRLIITSVKNGTEINEKFLKALEVYADHFQTRILAIPVRHRNIGEETDSRFPDRIKPYIFDKNIHFKKHKLKILGSLKINSAIENPLGGLDSISKGSSLIIGHPQIQLKTLPRIQEDYPAIVTTTGSVSEKNYTQSKNGTKADFNHSTAALIVEFDQGFVHIRHLNYDFVSEGFNDLDKWYGADGSILKFEVQALVTGDEHVIHKDETVAQVTYTNHNSLVNILKPLWIVRHDVFDSYSISHHHEKNFFVKYSKFQTGLCKVEDELETTINFINETTPRDSTSIIIQSNHNDHLTKWLNECDPKTEPWNAKVYHKLMYEMLNGIESGKFVDAFQMYSQGKFNSNVTFSNRNEGLSYKGIMLESHGDIGSNGSKGSRKQFSILPTKSVIGHSHSPGIEKGCYQTGTSSKMRLEYNIGASSWHHAHCIIHQSGKRQLIFITHGKYRL